MRFYRIASSLLYLLGTASLQAPAQEPAHQDEDRIIEANRRGARPRPVVPGRGLSELERQRAAIFQNAKNSVVYVNASSRVRVPSGDVYSIPAGTGTGFVWDELGHVVTNHHVLTLDDQQGFPRGDAGVIQVMLSNGKAYKARMIGRSLEHDLAVLHVFAPLKDLKPLPIGRSSNLRVGQSVLAIGNPFGLDHTMSGGIVSALDRELLNKFGTPMKGMIQTDASINPGNSGGPLLDSSGRLIGMNTAIPAATGVSVGIGFAIPVDVLNRVVPLLIARGNMNQPTLGFTTLSRVDAYLRFQVDRGVVVDEVDPGGPANQAGLQGLMQKAPDLPLELGDVIVGFQGKAVETATELADLFFMARPGIPLEFEVLRDGKRRKLVMRPGAPAPLKPTTPSL